MQVTSGPVLRFIRSSFRSGFHLVFCTQSSRHSGARCIRLRYSSPVERKVETHHWIPGFPPSGSLILPFRGHDSASKKVTPFSKHMWCMNRPLRSFAYNFFIRPTLLLSSRLSQKVIYNKIATLKRKQCNSSDSQFMPPTAAWKRRVSWGHPRPRQGDAVPLHPLLNSYKATKERDIWLLTTKTITKFWV